MRAQISGAMLYLAASCCMPCQADDMSAAYVGGNFARELNSYNTGYLDRQYASQAASLGDSLGLTNRSVHRFNWVWWGDVGYFFSPYIALDAAYFHLGELRYKSAGLLNVGGVEDATATSAEITSRGPALSVLGRVPLTESFEADVRLGDYFGKTNFYDHIDVAGGSGVTRVSKTTSALLAGVGAAYTFGGHWSVRLDYLRVNKTGDSKATGTFSVNLASAGVSFFF
jgi:hypothetical protein